VFLVLENVVLGFDFSENKVEPKYGNIDGQNPQSKKI